MKDLNGVAKNLKTIKDHSRLWVRNQVLNTYSPVLTADTFNHQVYPALTKPETSYDFSNLTEKIKILNSQLTDLENKFKSTNDENLLTEYTRIKHAHNLASDTIMFSNSTTNILDSIAISAGAHKGLNFHPQHRVTNPT